MLRGSSSTPCEMKFPKSLLLSCGRRDECTGQSASICVHLRPIHGRVVLWPSAVPRSEVPTRDQSYQKRALHTAGGFMSKSSFHLRPRALGWALTLALPVAAAVAQTPAPPVASAVARVDTIHGDVMVDNYFWLRDRKNP